MGLSKVMASAVPSMRADDHASGVAMRSREDILSMYEQYQAGKTLEEVGQANGLTRARIGQLFDREGLERRTAAETAAIKTEDISDEEIIALYKELGSVDAVLGRINCSRALITEIVSDIPDRENYQGRRADRLYSKEEYLRAVRRAAEVKGEPLTIPGYREVAQAEGLPSIGALLRFFQTQDGSPWELALTVAGIKGNPSRGRASRAITPERCITSVVECIVDQGQRPTYKQYYDWSKQGKERPSGPTVRNKVGWNKAVKEALDRLADHAV